VSAFAVADPNTNNCMRWHGIFEELSDNGERAEFKISPPRPLLKTYRMIPDPCRLTVPSSLSGAATKRWILQGLHSEAVHNIPVYCSTEHVYMLC
jgi:hypothetical protein